MWSEFKEVESFGTGEGECAAAFSTVSTGEGQHFVISLAGKPSTFMCKEETDDLAVIAAFATKSREGAANLGQALSALASKIDAYLNQ